MIGQHQIEEEWEELDPIFIRGMQRSGTSVVIAALGLLGFTGFNEGHLWFELLRPFSRYRDPEYRPRMKRDNFALGQGRGISLEKYVAVAIDEFHRDMIPNRPTRWVDKSPGPPGVEAASMLAQVFPKSQFIFLYRSGVTTIRSGLKLWSERPGIFDKLCTNWQRVMSTWRHVRDEIEPRYLEIRQEELASDPDKVADQLTAFVGAPQGREAVGELFRSQRVNTAFPDKAPRDYDYEIDWSDEQKAFFIETCGEEMEIWGYSVPWVSGTSRQDGEQDADMCKECVE